MSKLFEIIVACCLTAWAETLGVLESGNFGGQKGLGTEDALFALDHWVKAKRKEGKTVTGLFLDVKLAYPLVHLARLIHHLFQLKFPTYSKLIIADFLKGRSTTIRLGNYTSKPFDINIDLAQGSLLSVILYIIYNNLLLNQSFSTLTDMVSIGYVDNSFHLLASPSQMLIREGARFLRWGCTHGAIFDQTKAHLIWLTKGQPPQDVLPFGAQKLSLLSEVRWLGLWLSWKLLFNLKRER